MNHKVIHRVIFWNLEVVLLIKSPTSLIIAPKATVFLLQRGRPSSNNLSPQNRIPFSHKSVVKASRPLLYMFYYH